jgi:hypothetical protein
MAYKTMGLFCKAACGEEAACCVFAVLSSSSSLRPCLLLRYFYPKRCRDTWRFGVHPIPSNPFKYPSPKILYHDGEFLI